LGRIPLEMDGLTKQITAYCRYTDALGERNKKKQKERPSASKALPCHLISSPLKMIHVSCDIIKSK